MHKLNRESFQTLARLPVEVICVLAIVAIFAAPTLAQSFGAPIGYPVGSTPYDAAVGDFNSDGKLDLVTANNSAKSLSILLGNGSGSFGSRTDYDMASGPYSVVAFDFNGDGKLDLATTNYFAQFSRVSVLIGNGDGTFNPRVDYSFSGLALNPILAVDLNGDGKRDLVTASLSGASTFLGNGNGTFQPAVNYSFCNFATGVVAGDFNSDTKLDLAVSSYDHGISVLLGNGDGTFGTPIHTDAGASAYGLTRFDFNGDGKLDLATTNLQLGKVRVLFGNGDGTFQTNAIYNSGVSPFGISASDLTNDGKLDLIIPGNGGGISVLAGNGNGTFGETVQFLSGGVFATPVDLNADGKLDLLTAIQDAVAVMFNQTGPFRIDGVVTDATNTPMSGVIVTLAGTTFVFATTDSSGAFNFHDLPGSGIYSVVASRPNYTFTPANFSFTGLTSNVRADFTATLRTYSISGKIKDIYGNFKSGVTVTLSGASTGAVITGADGAYAFTNLAGGGNYTVTPTLANLNFSPPASSFTNLSNNMVRDFVWLKRTYSILATVTDVNGRLPDNTTLILSLGRNDVAFTDSSASHNFTGLTADLDYQIRAYPASSNRLFTDTLMLPPPEHTFSQLNSNVTANFNVKRLFFNAGGLNPLGVAHGDLNRDGKPDLVLATTTGNQIHVFIANGDGSFQNQVPYVQDAGPFYVRVADFNGDGKPDVAATNGGSMSIFIGNGDGTLQARVSYQVSGNAGIFQVGDVNNDGKNDLIVLSAGNILNVLIGKGDGTFQPNIARTIATAFYSLNLADLNGDSKLDVVVQGFPGNILVLMGAGNGTFADPVTYAAGNELRRSTVADMNLDGKLDIAFADFNGYGVLRGNGDGTFQAALRYSLSTDTADIISADFDLDGKPDLALGNYAGGAWFVSGNGDGSFKTPVHYAAGSYLGSLIATDLNGDSRPDLAVASQGSDSLVILLNAAATRAPALQFSSSLFNVSESTRSASITVTRTGDSTSAASIDYRTIDNNAPVRCDTINGTAYARCDYATSLDTLTFAPGETTKTISIPIFDDAFSEGNETFQLSLSNAKGTALGTTTTATVTINDNDQSDGTNPIFTTSFFVRQNYLDFLSREPEVGEPWSAILNNCSDVNNNPACDRLTVSASFFGSTEFQLKGYFVYRFYKLAFNRLPSYEEIVGDMRSVTGQTALELFQKKTAYTNSFVERTEFRNALQIPNGSFVSTLMGRYGLEQITTPDPAVPDGSNKVTFTTADLINHLNAETLTRAQVFRAIADSDQVFTQEFNKAFVAMQYYGYLRRTPETAGYNAWLNHLNDHPNDFRTMVNGFMNSLEYRLRFGP